MVSFDDISSFWTSVLQKRGLICSLNICGAPPIVQLGSLVSGSGEWQVSI
jgi:hypothetical protein